MPTCSTTVSPQPVPSVHFTVSPGSPFGEFGELGLTAGEGSLLLVQQDSHEVHPKLGDHHVKIAVAV
jgi:hypothetical protein